jgi:hypothetical protein
MRLWVLRAGLAVAMATGRGLVMSGIDRPSDDQWDTPDVGLDRAPDVPQSASAASVDRGTPWGTVLTDACTRREYALAYRAKVDAVYARAEREADLGGADKADGRPSVVGKYPDDYQRPTHDPPRIDGSHVSPEKWIRDINIDADLPGRSNNCGECARAACETWYGKPTAAAAMSATKSSGEHISRMEDWADQPSQPATMAEIGRRLEDLGPGSSAIVGCYWNRRGGHWFNAVNDGGAIKAVDGQRDRVGSWPPVLREFRFDESRMMLSFAIFFDPDGKVLRNDHS